MPKLLKAAIIAVVALILFLILNPLVIVGASERGLKVTLGKVGDQTLQPGLYFRIPLIQSVEKYEIVPQQVSVEISVDERGAITSDNQVVGLSTAIYYRFDDSKLVDMRKNWGKSRTEDLIETAMRESVKEVVGKYTIFQVAENQGEVRGKVTDLVRSKASQYPLSVTEVRITDYDWSDAFDAQIAATMEKAQQVRQAEQEKLIVQQKAEQQVVQAKADADARIASAQGTKDAAKLNAEAKELEGQGIAKYQALTKQDFSVTVRLKELEIELEKAKKFNGKVVPDNYFTPFPYPQLGVK
jgi:regulator of protease activity HflC (stomatin/prohibitin superfamily)